MDFILTVVSALLEGTGVKEKVGRSEQVIRLKQRFGLSDIESLTKFDDVYAYALVEYVFDEEGQRKPDALIQLFKAKEVRDVFRIAYRENDAVGWLQKGEAIALHKLGNQLPGVDPQRELGIFAALFIEIVKQTRSPKEIRQEQKLDSLQQSLQQVQARMQRMPSLEAVNQLVNQLAGVETLALPAAAENSSAADLARQLGEWFEVLDYDRDKDYEVWAANYFEWIINFPVGRRRVSRTLVRGVSGEVGMADLQAFQQAVENAGADEGWLVGNRRVSKATRTAVQTEADYETISCYTFDELLDEDADFSKYLDWLEAEIKSKGVDTEYLPLACRKDELDPVSQRKIGMSTYSEEDGWIDGYVDVWLDDPAKEHLSVLGEFGTGKTWFALHYAWVALQRYRDAKRRGMERPRIPVVVPLRDYAKAVTVESLFSEFFFRKHEVLKSYAVFEKLNRMGKLLLIFDGFDEMAARVNRQAMIDNFWELAKVVVPGAKAILTCRTEHFPNAIEGRTLLSAELQSSTAQLTGETPQFEVLELDMFGDNQIKEIIARKAQAATVQIVIGNSQLLDLARRPVMVDLILEALPDIEAGKPVDMARVYLYAVTRKMENDIKNERTFTSLADKLYFLCELSWEMLSTNQMSLNYRAFPERLQQMFSDRMNDEKELDHWRYDMMGQTMLIRNSEGDYSPAHRSLLEFFTAYKIVASLGVMAEDFTNIARQQSHLNEVDVSKDYTWNSYFKGGCDEDGLPQSIAPLMRFEGETFSNLAQLLCQSKLAKAVLELAHPMLDESLMSEKLLWLIQTIKEKTFKETGYFGSNIIQLMLTKTPNALTGSNLSRMNLPGIDFTNAHLQRVNFRGSSLTEALLSKALGSVCSVAFSPTGKYLAVGDRKSLQVWDVASGQVVLFCSTSSSRIWSVAFSPDEQLIASSSDDYTVKLWATSNGDCVSTLEGHSDWVSSVAFSPDGKVVASGSRDTSIRLWSVINGSCLHLLNGHTGWVGSIAFSPDGGTLASGGTDHLVKLWDRTSGNCIRIFEGHSGWIWSVAFSPDRQTLASGSGDNTVKLWSISSGACIQAFTEHSDWVRAVAFSPDGKILASASSDTTVKLWSVIDGNCVHSLESHSAVVRTIAFSPDGETLASGSDDNTVKLWSTADGNCIQSTKGHSDWAKPIAFSSDEKVLALGINNNMVKLWSLVDSDCIHILKGHADTVRALTFSLDGKILASGSMDATVRLWSVISGECIHTLEGHSDWIWSVAFSPDGKTVASGSRDTTVRLWSVISGECLHSMEGHSARVRSIAISPNGEFLASGGQDTTIRLWSVANGECIHTLEGHSDWVGSVSFSLDSQLLASGSADRMLKLWSVVSGNCVRILKGHSDWIGCIAFSPDGKLIASGSEDRTVKLWSIHSDDCMYTLEGHSDWVRTVAFSKDGQRLISGGADETIRFWDVETGECIRVIDDRVCAGLDITGTVGLTNGQRTALKLMGAVDRDTDHSLAL